jgi:hypothetical protein
MCNANEKFGPPGTLLDFAKRVRGSWGGGGFPLGRRLIGRQKKNPRKFMCTRKYDAPGRFARAFVLASFLWGKPPRPPGLASLEPSSHRRLNPANRKEQKQAKKAYMKERRFSWCIDSLAFSFVIILP